MAVYMRYDKAYDSYSRKIYSVLEFLGDIGGFKETLLMFGQFVIGFIVERLFYAKIMKNIYHTRKYKDDRTFYNEDEYAEMLARKKKGCCGKKKKSKINPSKV